MINARKKRIRRQNIFIFLMLLLPVAHFVLSQFLNFNMVFMAFNDYTFGSNNPRYVGWDNFRGVFRLFDSSKVENEWFAVKNSLSLAFLTLFINAPISLAFAYLLYIKVKGYKWMRVILYLPCVTSAVVLVLIFKSFMDPSGPLEGLYGWLNILDKWPNEGWLGPNTAWRTILIFSVWTGFSTNLIFFLSAMNRIPQDFIEAAKLDGASEPKVLFKIVLPLISSTVCTMLTIALASIFGWCMPSLLFMRGDSGMYNTGTLGLSVLKYTSAQQYGTAAAYGILLTLIGAPITLAIRALAKKLQCEVDY